MTFGVDDNELRGWEDGYYGQRRNAPSFNCLAYQVGYWSGCHERRLHDERLDELVKKWAAEDSKVDSRSPGEEHGG